MTHHMNAVSLAEHQRVLSMASEFADRAEQAEAAIARVRGIPEKESDVGYPNDWHIGWNACRESVLDALEEQLTNEVPDSYIQMKARALTAEAAIARVREVCDQRDAEVADMDAFYRQVVLVSVDEVRRALDWGDE